MTHYEPHPAHVLVADSLFESRKRLILGLFDEPDYCERWDLAHKLLGKYTRREVYALASKLNVEQEYINLQQMCEFMASFIANLACIAGKTGSETLLPVDMLANPAKSLPLSAQWGSMENEQQ